LNYYKLITYGKRKKGTEREKNEKRKKLKWKGIISVERFFSLF
jgi:hypothetical protein